MTSFQLRPADEPNWRQRILAEIKGQLPEQRSEWKGTLAQDARELVDNALSKMLDAPNIPAQFLILAGEAILGLREISDTTPVERHHFEKYGRKQVKGETLKRDQKFQRTWKRWPTNRWKAYLLSEYAGRYPDEIAGLLDTSEREVYEMLCETRSELDSENV